MEKVKRPLVLLEPELQQMAELWSVSKRLAMARVYARWARQLRVSAKILGKPVTQPQRAEWKRLRPLRLRLN